MEYIESSIGVQGKILCCECGIPIDPNPSNQCLGCIRARNDITEEIPKTAILIFCRECERYFDPPSTWILAGLESKELLRLCLKKLKGMNTVRLVDASFVWTEPHSKRIKLKLVVQKEIMNGAILQQDFIVEFTVQNQMCTDCHRVEAKDFWNAIVQVRQKTDHKKTFYYLEQLILRHNVHQKALGIRPNHGGLDFLFASEQTAVQMLDFLQSTVPCRWVRSKKLKSHDIHSNTYNYKHSFSCEIVPICKDSVVCLSKQLAHSLGGIGRLCIVLRVTDRLTLIDPNTAQVSEVSSTAFWKTPFNELCTTKHLTEFIVIDVNEADVRTFTGQGQISHKHEVCEAWVQRASELGVSDPIFTRSHLGRILRPGDSVYGFDLKNSNVNDDNLEKMKLEDIPDVVLVKKFHADKSARNRRRRWKLKHLDLDGVDLNSQNRDYMDFLEDLEEDPRLRANVNLYRDVDKFVGSETGDSDMPTVGLEEMLDDLEIDMGPDENEPPE